jgi:hypothetical protein
MRFDPLTLRILWAQAIDNVRTAIVIQLNDQFIGGVAFLEQFEYQQSMESDYSYRFTRPSSMTLWLKWEWNKVVSSIEEFRDSEEWKQKQISQDKKLLTYGERNEV